MSLYIRKSMAYDEKLDKMTRYLNQWNALSETVISGKGMDSFGTPKDIAQGFFSAVYELKEYIVKNQSVLVAVKNIEDLVLDFIHQNSIAGLSIDIANTIKHGELTRPLTNKRIGKFNAHLSIFSYLGDSTNVTVEIDGKPEDVGLLIFQTFSTWKNFLGEIDKKVQDYYEQ